MLMRRLLFVFLSAVVLGSGTVAVTSSPAAGETCHDTVEGPEGDQIEIEIPCSDDGDGVGGGDEAADGNGGGDAAPIGDRKCTYGPAITVDCETTAGTWNGTCYVKVADPQPDNDHPAWGDHEDGVILQCTAYDAPLSEECDADDAAGGCPVGLSYVWAPGPPDEGPSPAELARQAVARMELTAGDIGTTPNNGEPAIYGFPTWLWVDNPAPNTTGPITTSASDGDLTVTATGTLDRIEYDMGDGGSVTCAGADAPGTPYDASYDPPGTTGGNAAHSPTCGYMYTDTSAGQPGEAFAITATSYWSVEWSGGGQNGTIPIDLSTTHQHQVAEVQVILTTPNA